MTNEMNVAFSSQLDAAQRDQDDKNLKNVMVSVMKAEMECQCKMSVTVQSLSEQVRVLQGRLECMMDRFHNLLDDNAKLQKMLYEIVNKFNAYEQRAFGAKMLWDFLKVICGAGGGALLLKLLTH